MEKRPIGTPWNLRLLTFLLVLGVVVFLLVQLFQTGSSTRVNSFSYSHFVDEVRAGRVAEVVIQGSKIEGILRTGERFSTQGPPEGSSAYNELIQLLDAHGVSIQFQSSSGTGWFITILGYVLPVILVIAFWSWMMRRMQGTSAFTFTQSRAKLVTKEYTKVTFKDVAGIDEVLEEVREIVDYLKDPGRFVRLGAKIPKGILLVGPPGTGKTLLARAIAGEAGVPFFSISGSDFVEMFVGVGAARVRDMFQKAKANAPCIVFIDELDAVGRKRGAGIGGGHDEREQTLNQLLAEMDGFEGDTGVIVLAATNRPDVLDPALLRPGRFDRKIVVPPPDLHGREAILRVHTRQKKLASDVDLNVLARRTPGFVGADLENLCNEAALLAARKNKPSIEMADFEEALDRVLTGLARKGMYIREEERKRIAYHEAGHALVSKLVPHADPLLKVTIVPRGMGALGYALQLPTEDRYLLTKAELTDRLTVLLGGRAAEEVVFGDQTTGAAEDLKHATELAKRMVVEYGMSEELGPLSLGKERTNIFLGEEIVKSDEHSEELNSAIDREIRRIVLEAYARAKELISQHRPALERLAQELLQHETLDKEDVDRLLADLVSQPVG
ncbi:MAG: ATP-dependent zinc metalloprotease FtsH [Candidatus Bipolaricaulota bacterium]|nr:ATP-dependent zinc metalloprotease FtsH [Candidatus Bipolaricaulota bacterium]MDW8127127.1 ATP-dependent zinc metalloprotease FtsH [Candidatus Bipolaricaulota bacterium]